MADARLFSSSPAASADILRLAGEFKDTPQSLAVE